MKKKTIIITTLVILLISSFSTAFAQGVNAEKTNTEKVAFDAIAKAVDYHPTAKYALLFDMYDCTGTSYDTYTAGNDMIGIEDALSSAGYNVYTYNNATANGMLNILSQIAQQVPSNDTLLFGFSGYGADGGYLYCGDGAAVTISQIKTCLDSHAGVNEVLIDANYSGDFIAKDFNADFSVSESTVQTDSQDKFNDHVIAVFDGSSTANSKTLTGSDYYVMTSTTGSQISSDHLRDYVDFDNSTYPANNFKPYVHDNSFYALSDFCYTFQYGMGLFETPAFSSMPGDSNSDGAITWDEMYKYIKNDMAIFSTVQVYPANSSHKIYYGDDYWTTDAETNGVATKKTHYVKGYRTEVNTYFTTGELSCNIKYDGNGYETRMTHYYSDGTKYSTTTYYPSSTRVDEILYYEADGITRDCKYKYADSSNNQTKLRTDYTTDGKYVEARTFYDTDGGTILKHETYFTPSKVLKSKTIYTKGWPSTKAVYNEKSVMKNYRTYYTTSTRINEIICYQVDGSTIDYKLKYTDTVANNKTLKTNYAINGIIMESRTYYDNDGKTITYYEQYFSNGNVQYEGYYNGGVLNHTAEYNDSFQLLKETYVYSNGKRKEVCFFNPSTGKLTAISEYNTSGKILKKTYMHSNEKRKIAYFFSATTGKKYAYSEYRTDASIIKKTYIYSTGVRKKVYFFSQNTGKKYATSEYRSDGSIEKKTYLHSNGQRKIAYFFSQSTGKKYAISEYRTDGSIEKKIYLYSNGARKKTYFFSESTGKQYATSEYRTDGTIAKKTYLYTNGTRQKAYFFSESTGKKYALSYYNSNGDITKKIYYNTDGSVKETRYF